MEVPSLKLSTVFDVFFRIKIITLQIPKCHKTLWLEIFRSLASFNLQKNGNAISLKFSFHHSTVLNKLMLVIFRIAQVSEIQEGSSRGVYPPAVRHFVSKATFKVAITLDTSKTNTFPSVHGSVLLSHRFSLANNNLFCSSTQNRLWHCLLSNREDSVLINFSSGLISKL